MIKSSHGAARLGWVAVSVGGSVTLFFCRFGPFPDPQMGTYLSKKGWDVLTIFYCDRLPT